MMHDGEDYITKEEVNEMLKTEEGRKRFSDFLYAQRITQGLAQVFARMGMNPPPTEVQKELFDILWQTLRRIPPEEIIENLIAAHHLKNHGLCPVDAADLMAMRPMGDA